ncbi:head decoration protein [Desulfatiglans anilini]|uniref:head decoration protein n=1 Tax=Desulfatiglans anilini TaxID=90728 RepID=UPI0004112CE7|nr:head decoration protein [Desulfatiglans anilini]
MAGTFGVTVNESAELSQLVAGEGCIQRDINLKASAGALARGTVLEMVSVTSGQWQQLQAEDGSNARAILCEAAADSDAIQKKQAYFVGKYRASDLVWPDGISATQKRTAIVALQDRGIVIDETILDAAEDETTTTEDETTTTEEETTTTEDETTTTEEETTTSGE